MREMREKYLNSRKEIDSEIYSRSIDRAEEILLAQDNSIEKFQTWINFRMMRTQKFDLTCEETFEMLSEIPVEYLDSFEVS